MWSTKQHFLLHYSNVRPKTMNMYSANKKSVMQSEKMANFLYPSELSLTIKTVHLNYEFVYFMCTSITVSIEIFNHYRFVFGMSFSNWVRVHFAWLRIWLKKKFTFCTEMWYFGYFVAIFYFSSIPPWFSILDALFKFVFWTFLIYPHAKLLSI